MRKDCAKGVVTASYSDAVEEVGGNLGIFQDRFILLLNHRSTTVSRLLARDLSSLAGLARRGASSMPAVRISRPPGLPSSDTGSNQEHTRNQPRVRKQFPPLTFTRGHLYLVRTTHYSP